MPRFCADLTALFTDLPLLERFAAAKDAGFDGVEVPFPYDVNAQDIVNELTRHDLKMVSMNCPPPNYTGGDQGFAAMPGLQDRFRRDFKRALRYAKTLGAQHLHVMAGTADGPEARAVYIDNLRWAAAEAPKQSLVIAPMDAAAMPGYFLTDIDVAHEIVKVIDVPNLRLYFDTSHASTEAGGVPATWEAMRDVIAHIQISPLPRNLDLPTFFAKLDKLGYAGWVSRTDQP